MSQMGDKLRKRRARARMKAWRRQRALRRAEAFLADHHRFEPVRHNPCPLVRPWLFPIRPEYIWEFFL